MPSKSAGGRSQSPQSNSSGEEEPAPTRTPFREDCWSEEATRTLIEAWGFHHLQLNRSSLRREQWDQIRDSVNALHAHSPKLHRSDIQCKNRIDTLKKKYKAEKLKPMPSTWPFFHALDDLIGLKFPNSTPSPAPARPRRSSSVQPLPPYSVPVGLRSKRAAPKQVDAGDDSDWTATPASGKSKKTGDGSYWTRTPASGKRKKTGNDSDWAATPSSGTRKETADGSDWTVTLASAKGKKTGDGDMVAEGFLKLAEAIGGFAEVYEKVEGAKQRQLVELEKQRMQFAKDIEIQRVKLFMESQLELEKLRTKQNLPSGGFKS